MKILVTGASGFLGKSLVKRLTITDEVFTLSRSFADLNIDLTTMIPHTPEVDVVIHAAGKAHIVPKSAQEKQAFFDVNVNGTANLLKGLEIARCLPNSFIFISTVAVYGCDSGVMINEDHPLNATDPYGQSKIQAERIVQDWCVKNNVICGILRLPLLVGENPPGNLGAMIKGIDKGYYFNIAGGKARKSMVFTQDVANILPIIAIKGGIYNLTDNYHPSFAELAIHIAKQLGKKKVLNLPLIIAKIMARMGDLLGNKAPINSIKMAKIIKDLTFDDSKAKKQLNWKPNPILQGFNIK
ncbi:NAD-dependent epimerase/dehydratase family protein [Pedobacter alluvionis]|uniref:NAD-dependent epimerase/dehydratase family protein n=1 Tax=Pedobacter alluvionis TaxID=475253 RepID=A0A497Y2J3_9SPHI|nr:NAD-dependent epimerase/dehydratase family protein [Pedobacter alluvionis]RLJ73901.1 nucleoside-diphosphate-sugar epimerase [Pedobacter alluvionis]TFB32492.1 NAD-dependent epimerase/dehydratase family protein [Pedobacter alluvionis]